MRLLMKPNCEGALYATVLKLIDAFPNCGLGMSIAARSAG